MKKTLLTIATVFYIISTMAVPILGFALLEPTAGNLVLISLLFCASVFASVSYYDALIQHRRNEMNKFEEDIKKAFKIHTREEMKAMFKKLDKEQGA